MVSRRHLCITWMQNNFVSSVRPEILSTEGGVRDLRRRLADSVKSDVMGGVDTQRQEMTGESGELWDNELPPVSLAVGDGVLNIDRSDHGSVFVDLLMQVPPLLSERPEDIMFFSSGWVKFIAWV